MNSITPLLGLSSEELTRWVIEQGQPSYRAKQLHQWLYTRNIRSLDEVTVFPKSWREQNKTTVGRSTIALKTPTPDGTVKFLLALADGQTVETVGIPSRNTDGLRLFSGGLCHGLHVLRHWLFWLCTAFRGP